MMKRYLIYFVFSVILAACKSESPDVIAELTLSTNEIKVEKENVAFFHVKSNVSWQAKSSAAWCKLVQISGETGTSKVDITLEPNTELKIREAVVTITAGNLVKEVKVIQNPVDVLNIEKDLYTLNAEGGSIQIKLETSGNITKTVSATWLKELNSGGTALDYQATINRNHLPREGVITLTLGEISKEIKIVQEGQPLTISANKVGMESDAPVLASKMKVGWNLGNSLEAAASDILASETMWGNPATTKAMIDMVKNAGFNAVRIPTAWSGYIENRTTQRIKDEWIERVKEVVDYCVSNQLYAIINIHWDGGWLENNPTYAKQAEVNAKQKKLWQQIAVVFRDYDEHLLFAGTNEVHADYNTPSKEHLEVQMSFNQTFVDAVRATGGRNTWRTLISQSYNTNIALAQNHLVLPKDPTSNRTMAEVHYYDPWDFCGEETNSPKYLWGKEFKGDSNASSWGQEEWAQTQFGLMKEKFVSKGIPVILGEYGAMYRGSLPANLLANHKVARNNYLHFITKTAKENGLIPFYWDNGVTGNNGFGLFNRSSLNIVHPDAVEAIITAAK